jgi:hypothetical protein
MADVEVIATYELCNINWGKRENLLHRLFDRVVSEKSIVLSWAVLKCSVHPTDREMYPCSVVDQFPGWIVHQRSRVDCSEFRYDGASDTTCPGQRSE